MTRIIVVASGKGGVGKTFTSVNLAAALSVFGKDVTIIDANITTPNVGLNLGINKMPLTLHDVLEGRIPMSRAIYLHPSGVKIIPAGMSIADLKRTLRKDLREAILDLIGKTEYIKMIQGCIDWKVMILVMRENIIRGLKRGCGYLINIILKWNLKGRIILLQKGQRENI